MRRKYAKLPWNKYYENHPEEKSLSEQKINKVVEDNSVVLERMKKVSSSCDKILQTIDSNEPNAAAIIEPLFMSTEPIPELEELPQTIDLKKMLKKDLLILAEERGCSIKSSMTKANIIKAIEETK